MKRNEWTFSYGSGKLAEAAIAKREHHKSRQQWWSEKKAEVVKRVGETGIDVQESLAIRSEGAFGPQLRIDAGLQRDLTESEAKIREHRRAFIQYDGWAQFLQGNAETSFALDHEDYDFFFGK